jgi:serine/threonine-protein kinase
MIGTRLGPYEITAAIGKGGMGEVFRARDTKLNRDVAIKVLPAELSQDRERVARFRREAQVLASLNHPNIAAIYGLEDLGGVVALALELVEGEDLAERLKRGAIPVDEAIAMAKQIAEGLEEAHEKGIVHRDLKPANVKVTKDGVVKVLDFGLAKAYESDSAPFVEGAVSQSPTMSRHMTKAGIILGTAAYMSPEQARGKPVDKRSDIWAFGVVLYEMLSGKRLFDGETVSDVLAAVLTREPRWAALPATTPASARRLLRQCLERNPKNRLHAIADARLALDEAIAGRNDDAEAGPATTAQTAPGPPWRRVLPWVVGGALGLGVGIAGHALRGDRPGAEPRELPVSRFAVRLPADAPFVVNNYPGRALALSPDGTQIVYATENWLPDTRLRLRRLDETEIRSIPGTEKGRAPFFSPDGEWLAYFDMAEAALKKISVRGGKAVTLQRGFANAGWMFGTWCDDGRIVFDTWNGGLRVVGGDGGDPRILTNPTDEWHLDPQPLPGPCRVLFYTYRAEGHAIEAISVDSGERTRILDNASHGRFLASGHLLFVRDGALQLAPFDADRLTVTGPAIPLPLEAVVDSVAGSAPNPQLAVSRNGTLVYAPSEGEAGSESHLVSVTPDGHVEELGPLPFPLPVLALSPDSERLALAGRRAGRARIETLDLKRQATTSRIDLGSIDSYMSPVWTPDGKAILYARYGPVEGEIVRHVVDGSVPDEVLLRLPGTWFCPWSISPDGRFLVFSRYVPETAADLLLLDLEASPGSESVRPFVATPGSDYGAAISPNGEWFAYYSDESGGDEIFIEKFPERGQKTLVWNGPAYDPLWSPDGRELYFTARSTRGSGERAIMAARVELEPALRVSEPRTLFSGPYSGGSDMGRAFGITADGRHFLLIRRPQGAFTLGLYGASATERLVVVQNWFAELGRGQGKSAP